MKWMPTKSISPSFTADEHERLKEVKGDNRTWSEAILEEFGVDDE